MNFLKFRKDLRKSPADLVRAVHEQLVLVERTLQSVDSAGPDEASSSSPPPSSPPPQLQPAIQSGQPTQPHPINPQPGSGLSLPASSDSSSPQLSATPPAGSDLLLLRRSTDGGGLAIGASASGAGTNSSGVGLDGFSVRRPLWNTFFESDRLKRETKVLVRCREELCRLIQIIRGVLFGEGDDKEPSADLCNQFVAELCRESPVIVLFIKNLAQLDFEARKEFTQIFNTVVRRFPALMAAHLTGTSPLVVELLLQGYESSDIALHCGSMFRECIRHESVCRLALASPYFRKLFNYVDMPNFDVASDAFQSFKEILTKHKNVASEYLDAHFTEVFNMYSNLLTAQNYVTRRQSVRLLGELLLDRANFRIMTRYISDPENLKVIMKLLRDKSKSIQFEAFHIFKVFVANPNKNEGVKLILRKNKDKLILFLDAFLLEKDDEDFAEEKSVLAEEISKL